MRASALIAGSPDGGGEALADLARGLGFAPVNFYRDVMQAAQQADVTPLVFVLCAPVRDVEMLRPIADALRFSMDPRLRFAPLVYFCPDPSAESIRVSISMGFDDIIALPYLGGHLGERIGRQIGRHTYYETATYFGPDRRNRVGTSRSSDSDHGGGPFRRIEIVRSDTGVDVLRDDFRVVL